MRIVSVQTGEAADLHGPRGVETTGIDKRPTGQIEVATTGVTGDAIVGTRHHGGPDQAVYVYTREDYAVFEADLGVALAPGSFGENVTVDSLPEPVRIGDRIIAGDVTLEITAPRIPCGTFAAHMARVVGPDATTGWVKRFREARRPGWYCRVVAEGTLQAGAEGTVERAPESHVLGVEAYDHHYGDLDDSGWVQRALASPIAIRMRESLDQG